MAREPGSIWKPLPEAGAPDGHTKTQFIVHSTGTMASAAANWSYFNRGDVVEESTFIVGLGPADPTLQVMDSTDWADAVLSASGRAISVEVVGDGTGPFTDWQVGELIRLGLWAREAHGILPRIIPAPTEGGYGWHVMFGAPGPWTSVRGKVCPGSRRVQQLKDTIFPAIFAGGIDEEITVAAEQNILAAIADLKDYTTKGVIMRLVQLLADQGDGIILCKSPGRGVGAFGANYFRAVTTDEEADVTAARYGAVQEINDREFDVLQSASLGGMTASSTAAQLNEAVAKLAGVAGADVDEDALAAALAPRLSGVSKADIAEAVRGVLRAGVGA